MGQTGSQMMLAAKDGDAVLMKALLKSGQGKTEEANEEGWTVLHICASMGHVECVRVLLQYGAKVTAEDRQYYSPLHRAVQYFHVDCAQAIVQKILDMSPQQQRKALNSTNNFGATPLHWAAVWDSVDCMRVLLKAGANVHAKQHNNQTALHAAAKANSVEAVAVLLQAGADRRMKDDSNSTAAQLADGKEVRELLTMDEAVMGAVVQRISRRPVLQPQSAAVTCPTCPAKFGLTKRRHHCMKCGIIHCANCCSNTVNLHEMLNYPSPVRVCKKCFSGLRVTGSGVTVAASSPAKQQAAKTNSKPVANGQAGGRAKQGSRPAASARVTPSPQIPKAAEKKEEKAEEKTEKVETKKEKAETDETELAEAMEEVDLAEGDEGTFV